MASVFNTFLMSASSCASSEPSTVTLSDDDVAFAAAVASPSALSVRETPAVVVCCAEIVTVSPSRVVRVRPSELVRL